MTRPDAWCGRVGNEGRDIGEKSFVRLDFFEVIRRFGPAYKKVKKIEKTFEKGIAFFEKVEYNAEDVCKGDEVTDCSLAGEVTAMDHVRESDDGSRTLCRAKKPSSRT